MIAADGQPAVDRRCWTVKLWKTRWRCDSADRCPRGDDLWCGRSSHDCRHIKGVLRRFRSAQPALPRRRGCPGHNLMCGCYA